MKILTVFRINFAAGNSGKQLRKFYLFKHKFSLNSTSFLTVSEICADDESPLSAPYVSKHQLLKI